MEELCRCGLCHRVLKTEKAIERGFGKTCYRKVQQWYAEEMEKQAPSDAEIKRITEDGDDAI